jgi:sterol desaturase/sphingolipid hydroxylase (fatty acid hydroxylase superfamily)
VLLRLLIPFAVSAIVFGAIEAIWPAREQRRWRRGAGTDLVYWVFTPIVSRGLAALAIGATAFVIAGCAGVQLDGAHVRAFIHRTTWFGELPRAAQIAIVLIGGDLLGYWLHRMFHRGRMWRYHAVHHMSVDLDWLAATRLHPVNEIVQKIAQVTPFVILGVEPAILAGYVPLLGLFAIGFHANVDWSFGPLRYVIASPRFHRWHHTAEREGRDRNFAGLFPLWDLVFGTFYMPAGKMPTVFGVDEAIPDNLLGQLAWPFRR